MSSLLEPAPAIPLAALEAMFADMRARAPWNVDGPLPWGYFFLDPDARKLERAAAELTQHGYRIVGVQRLVDAQLARLHVERVETHTPASLDARNQELGALARRHAIASYDGMDVGPPGRKHP
jgi:hypothetical protein